MISHHLNNPLRFGFSKLTGSLVLVKQIREIKFLLASSTLVRFLRTRSIWMLGGLMSLHPPSAGSTCLEITTIFVTKYHLSSLRQVSLLVLDFIDHQKPAT